MTERPWNWCHKCKQPVDVDAGSCDGSEHKCWGCGRWFTLVAFEGDHWALFSATQQRRMATELSKRTKDQRCPGCGGPQIHTQPDGRCRIVRSARPTIAQRYAAGETVAELMASTGRSRDAIRAELRKANVKMRRVGRRSTQPPGCSGMFPVLDGWDET